MLVDTGSAFMASEVHRTLRAWRTGRLHTAIYSHGHIDHVFGVPVWAAESAEAGWPEPVVVAHEALPARFDRYIKTAGYNGIINRRQFDIDVPGVAHRVPLPRPHLPRPSRPRRRRGAGRTPPCQGRDRRPHLDLVPRRPRCCAAATCSSGPRPMPAIRRRSSATPWSGPTPSARCWPSTTRPRAVPRCCSPATATRWSGASGCVQALSDTAALLESLVEPDPGAHERRGPPGRGHPHRGPAGRPDGAALPPTRLRRARVHRRAPSGGRTAAGGTAIRPP